MRAVLIGLAAGLAGAVAGYFLSRLRWHLGALAALAGAALTLWLLVTARHQPGMEGLARVAVAVALSGPATVGAALGAGLAVWRRR